MQFLAFNFNISPTHRIYVRVSPEIASQRIQTRQREGENCLTLERIKELVELHDEWLLNCEVTECEKKVYIIDGNQD